MSGSTIPSSASSARATLPPPPSPRQPVAGTRVLAFDCALARCAVAAVRFDDVGEARTLAAATEPMQRGQAAALAPMAEATLELADWRPSTLDLLATTVGPGSFTGLRIGLAFARGLGLALGVPVAGVRTTEAIFRSVPESARAEADIVVVAIDAGRGRRYVGLFDVRNGEERGLDLFSDDDLVARLADRRVLVVGDAAVATRAMLAARGVATLGGGSPIVEPDLAVLAALAIGRGVDVWRESNRREGLPRPLYLRGADVTLRDGARTTADLDD